MGLKKILPLRTVTSTSAGLAFAAINFLAATQVANLLLGSSAWIAVLIAGLFVVLSALSFSELSGSFPSAAGIRLWTRLAFNDTFSLAFTLFYLTTVFIVIAADSFILAQALMAGLPSVPGLLWIFLFLTLVLWVNLKGIRWVGALQDSTTFFLLASLVILSFLALLAHPPALHQFWNLQQTNMPTAVAVGIFLYVGYEWVTPLAEEVRDARLLPKGMFLALALIGIGFGIFTLAASSLGVVAKHSLVPQLLVGREALGAFGEAWMVLITAVTAITTFNGSTVAASRLLFALSREKKLPRRFGRLNRHFVPDFALYALYVISLLFAALLFWTKTYTLLINLGATVESTMYVVAAAAVIRLRKIRPQTPRPFAIPMVRYFSGLSMVLFSILALLSALAPDALPDKAIPWTLLLSLLLFGLSFMYAFLYNRRYAITPKENPATER